MPELVVCVDVGSTFTKAVLVDADAGRLLGTAQHPTTLPDVMTGITAARDQLAAAVEPGVGAGWIPQSASGESIPDDVVGPDGVVGPRDMVGPQNGVGPQDVVGPHDVAHPQSPAPAESFHGSLTADDVRAADLLACSSAGGGLRLAVVGHERLVTAEAGQRVALSAGGRVVHLSSGRLTPDGVRELREARPDLIVLTGGTDGGNADVVLHNARRIGIARIPVPVVLACNRDAAEEAAGELRRRGRSVTVTANVLPSIGTFDPGPAREAIREAFLDHVIGGKGLSRNGSRINGRSFRQLVRSPTPDAVLTGVEALADGRGLLLVDVGGATTDVYSVLPADKAGSGTAAAGDWLSARTVEGDLGVRSGALGVVRAALAEGLIDDEEAQPLRDYASDLIVAGESAPAPELDVMLARLAVLVAVRRHGRAPRPGGDPRPLRDVGLVVGSGGVLRHAREGELTGVLKPIVADHAGGWAVPEKAELAVDARYALFAAGLLHGRADPGAVRRLAAAGLEPLP